MLSPIECAKIGLLYFFNRYKTYRQYDLIFDFERNWNTRKMSINQLLRNEIPKSCIFCIVHRDNFESFILPG